MLHVPADIKNLPEFYFVAIYSYWLSALNINH